LKNEKEDEFGIKKDEVVCVRIFTRNLG
jgi:hypothetical protein